MAHDLSINNTGNAELVLGSGASAWHSLGTVFPNLVTKEQAIAIAMPWNAESFEMLLPSRQVLEKTGIQITTNRTGRFAILRSDTAKTIGFVGEGYEVLQPSEMFDFMEGVNVKGFETAGALKNGSVLFLTAPVGEINVLGSGDITKTYLNFLNSFDGSIAAQVHMSGVRIVCRNTMNMSLSSANGRTLKFKHTKSLHDRMSQAQNIMAAQALTEENLKVALETLATRKLKRQTYEDILSDIFPGEATRTKNVKVEVTDLFQNNDNNFVPEFKGTAYALYNAITNYSDHVRDVRITKASANENPTLQRFESALIGTGAELKMRALERILVLSDGSEVLESNPFRSFPSDHGPSVSRYLSTVPEKEDNPIIDITPSDLGQPWSDNLDNTSYEDSEDSTEDFAGLSVLDSAPSVSVEDSTEDFAGLSVEDSSLTSQNAPQDTLTSDLVPEDSQGKEGPQKAQKTGKTRKAPKGPEKAQKVVTQKAKVDLYTTALAKFDLSSTEEISVVEVISETVKVRLVQAVEDTVLDQIDVYTREGFFVAGKEKWTALQAQKTAKK